MPTFDLASLKEKQQVVEVLANLIPKKVKKHRSRYETATALIRRLIAGGEKDLQVLAQKTLDAILNDEIKKPKTAHVIYSIIKRNMVDVVYRNNPRVKTFRDVLRIYNAKRHFSLAWIEQQAAFKGIQFEESGESTED